MTAAVPASSKRLWRKQAAASDSGEAYAAVPASSKRLWRAQLYLRFLGLVVAAVPASSKRLWRSDRSVGDVPTWDGRSPREFEEIVAAADLVQGLAFRLAAVPASSKRGWRYQENYACIRQPSPPPA